MAELGLIWKFLLRFGLAEFHKGGFGRAWISLEALLRFGLSELGYVWFGRA